MDWWLSVEQFSQKACELVSHQVCRFFYGSVNLADTVVTTLISSTSQNKKILKLSSRRNCTFFNRTQARGKLWQLQLMHLVLQTIQGIV